ncbi:hypothetical protein CA850_29665 [Micromonospora echinospora]|uniref:Uncharacterized protein n=1 Tax=Micromonospora echinospora TaxID=1877 RepID=A0A1C5AB79_MICEC|nr:hypothetical protein [Micromonospora echinospora]OZV74748.1 hypothetical protein CA850_29665 [Micromonospora echinospora]SCF42488.1 hypothetical protein GA0070618_6667 [Micromonospora echinospora]
MSAAKAKGTRWETALVRFFRAATVRAFRPAQEGFRDTGDLHGLDPFTGQAKDWTSWQAAIREGLDGAERQRVNAGQNYGVAFVKRARASTGRGYAVMTVATFARVLLRLRRAEALLAELAGPSDVFAEHCAQTARELTADFDALAKSRTEE